MIPEAAAAYVEAASVVGNPSSIHSAGQRARAVLEEAREQIAASLGCDPIEVVFTSGGTEAVNLALKGLYWARRDGGARTVLVPEGEHHATIDAVDWLERSEGARVERLPLEREGRVRLDTLEEALAGHGASVSLVTSLWVNNEVGTIQPVARIAELTARYGVPLHVDAVAAYGHLPLDFASLRRGASGEAGAPGRTGSGRTRDASGDGGAPGKTGGGRSRSASAGLVALSVSAHKIGGPVGIGALVLSRSADIVPLVHGGGQQRNVRSGTQDVAAAAAFAAAARIQAAELTDEAARLGRLRDRLVRGVLERVPRASLTGPALDSPDRVSSNAHFLFPGAQGDSLLFLLDAAGVAVSTGSACQAGVPEPSHVVLALGRSEEEARSALRITLGRSTTDADVDAFLGAIGDAYARAARAGSAARPAGSRVGLSA